MWGGYHPPAIYAAACGYSLCRGVATRRTLGRLPFVRFIGSIKWISWGETVVRQIVLIL